MDKYLDKNGLTHLWSKIKAALAGKASSVNNKGPDASGNISLAPSDLGAFPASSIRSKKFSLSVSAWSGSGTYSAVISDSSVTTKTCCVFQLSQNGLDQEATWSVGSGKITLTTGANPTGVVSGVIIMMEIAGDYAGGGTGMSGLLYPLVHIQGAKNVTPTKAVQNIAPDSGYDALAGVTVNAIPAAYQDVTPVTAGAGDVLTGKTFVSSDGKATAGAMPDRGTVNATIDGVDVTGYTIPGGKHSGSGTVKLDDTIEQMLKTI